MCKFPYYGESCDIKFADHIGEKYYMYQGLFIGLSLCSMLFTITQTFRVLYYTLNHKYKLQKIILLLSSLMSLFLTIQSIDPQGYRDILPSIFEVLISSLTTLTGLIIMFVLIIVFDTFIQDNINLFQINFWSIMIFISLIITITMDLLQVYVNRSIFRGIKLILFSIIITISSIKINYLLNYTYNLLVKQQDDTRRLVIHWILFNTFILFIVIYQFVSGCLTIIDKINNKPVLGADQIIFPLSEFIGIILVTSFMGNIKYEHKKTYEELIKNPLTNIKPNHIKLMQI